MDSKKKRVAKARTEGNALIFINPNLLIHQPSLILYSWSKKLPIYQLFYS